MLYRWHDPNSLIQQIELFDFHKEKEAFIYVPSDADKHKIKNLSDILRNKGFLVTPDAQNQKPVLRIQKFGARNHLFSVLQDIEAVKGDISTEKTDRDLPPKTLKQMAQENTMTLSGWMYLLGDGLVLASGLVRGETAETIQGALWATTGLELAFFGKKDPNKQMATLYRKLKDHLEAEGIEIPSQDQATLQTLAAKGGLINKTQEFLYNYPVEFNNSIQALGGIMGTQAGLNQKSPLDGKPNYYKAAAGVAVANGQFWGMVIPSKKKPPSHTIDNTAMAGISQPPTHQAAATTLVNGVPVIATQPVETLPDEPDHRSIGEKTIDWFHEKPLRITGILASTNNLLKLYGGYMEERPKINQFLDEKNPLGYAQRHQAINEKLAIKEQELAHSSVGDTQNRLLTERDALLKANEELAVGLKTAHNANLGYKWDVMSSLSYLVANTLYALSDKDTNADLKSLGGIDELTGMLSHIVAGQPWSIQKSLSGHFAGWLASQPEVKMSAQEINAEIQHKVQILHQTAPWVSRVPPSLGPSEHHHGTSPSV